MTLAGPKGPEETLAELIGAAADDADRALDGIPTSPHPAVETAEELTELWRETAEAIDAACRCLDGLPREPHRDDPAGHLRTLVSLVQQAGGLLGAYYVESEQWNKVSDASAAADGVDAAREAVETIRQLAWQLEESAQRRAA